MQDITLINRGFTIIKSKIRQMELEAIKKNNLDISDLQWNYLVWISENKTNKMNDLAKTLGIQKGTLSNNLKHLVDKKLIKKEVNGRFIKITVTTKGKKYIDIHAKTHEHIKEVLLGVLSEREIIKLVKIGTKLKNEL